MKSLKYLILCGLLSAGLVHAESAALGDGNGDGNQPQSENAGPGGQRPKGQQNQQRPNRPSKEDILAKFDANGDGQLDQAERETAREAHREEMALRRFDANKDGTLSNEERAQFDAFIAEREAKILERFDADGDGVLSDEERQAARQGMNRRQGQGNGQNGPADRRQGPPRSSDLGDVPAAPPGA
ncbi:EF-hand domain-containing protein [Cerasicoccus fimbriatus]|uniref:EF-hand domain-containing protein n=1 Tax=Cerasicoccus fimbriatus TaxID=3014554 RepID=UPI0022B3CEA1|nr:hypothetical protein [Cerasicoccus sp. TK19100]